MKHLRNWTELCEDHNIKPEPKDLQKYLSAIYKVRVSGCVNFFCEPESAGLVWSGWSLPCLFMRHWFAQSPARPDQIFHQICFVAELKGMVRSGQSFLEVKLHKSLFKDVLGQMIVTLSSLFVAVFAPGALKHSHEVKWYCSCHMHPNSIAAYLYIFHIMFLCLLHELCALHELCVSWVALVML